MLLLGKLASLSTLLTICGGSPLAVALSNEDPISVVLNRSRRRWTLLLIIQRHLSNAATMLDLLRFCGRRAILIEIQESGVGA